MDDIRYDENNIPYLPGLKYNKPYLATDQKLQEDRFAFALVTPGDADLIAEVEAVENFVRWLDGTETMRIKDETGEEVKQVRLMDPALQHLEHMLKSTKDYEGQGGSIVKMKVTEEKSEQEEAQDQ